MSPSPVVLLLATAGSALVGGAAGSVLLDGIRHLAGRHGQGRGLLRWPRRRGAPPATVAGTCEPFLVGRPPSPVVCRLPRVSSTANASFAVEAGQLDGVTVRVASCRGRAHMERGETLQDAYVVLAEPSGRWVVAAVADGVGGSPNAMEAARAAVASVARRAPGWLADRDPSSDERWRALLTSVAADVDAETRDLGGPRRLLGGSRPQTTLAVVVATGGALERGRVCCAAVGDTEVLRLSAPEGRPARWVAVLPAPEGDRRFGAERTAALPTGVDRLRWTEIEWSSDVLLIASDGFAGAMGGGNSLEATLAELWRRPPSPLDFLRQVDFRLATHSDDRTVVALWRGAHDERYA